MSPPIVALIFALAAVTYATRVGAIAALRVTGIPGWLERLVRYVPVGVLTALIVPAVLAPGGALSLSIANHYLVAAIPAGVVAWKTQNVLATVTVGITLVLVQGLL